MRAPTRAELLLVALAVVGFALWRSGLRSAAAKEAELELVKAETAELESELERSHNETDALRREKADADRAAADSLAVLSDVIDDAELRAEELASSGREVFEEIIETVPDALPDLRALVIERERIHNEEIAQKDTTIAAERDAAAVLRGQLTAANSLILGQGIELGASSALIGSLENENQILEELRSPGLSTLEAVSISVNAYFVSTQALDASTVEGLIVGGATFVVLEGGSKLLGWIF